MIIGRIIRLAQGGRHLEEEDSLSWMIITSPLLLQPVKVRPSHQSFFLLLLIRQNQEIQSCHRDFPWWVVYFSSAEIVVIIFAHDDAQMI
jgi:hypothetical protein